MVFFLTILTPDALGQPITKCTLAYIGWVITSRKKKYLSHTDSHTLSVLFLRSDKNGWTYVLRTYYHSVELKEEGRTDSISHKKKLPLDLLYGTLVRPDAASRAEGTVPFLSETWMTNFIFLPQSKKDNEIARPTN